MLSMLGKNCSRHHFEIFFLFFPRKKDLTCHANCLLRKQFAWIVKAYLRGKIKKKTKKTTTKNKRPIINLSFAELAQRKKNGKAGQINIIALEKSEFLHRIFLGEVLLMSTHNICFCEVIRKISILFS